MRKEVLVIAAAIVFSAASSRAQESPISALREIDRSSTAPFQMFQTQGQAVSGITMGFVGSQLSQMWLFAISPKDAFSPVGAPNIHSSAASNVTVASGAIAGAFFGDMIAKKKDLSPLQGIATSGAMWVGMFVGGNIGAAIGGVPVYYKFTFNDVSSMKSRAPLYYAATLGSIGAVAAGMAVLSMIADDADHATSTISKVQFDVNPAGIAEFALKQPSPNQTKIASLRCSW